MVVGTGCRKNDFIIVPFINIGIWAESGKMLVTHLSKRVFIVHCICGSVHSRQKHCIHRG